MGGTKQGKKRSLLLIVCLLLLVLASVFFWMKSKSSGNQGEKNDATNEIAETQRVESESLGDEGVESEQMKSKASGEKKKEAWGPERVLYTWDKRADYATINSITDNPVLGDERNFVRIRKLGTEDKYEDIVEAEPGAEYEVQIYFHNNADSKLNDESGRTFAQNIRVRMENIAGNITKGQYALIKGVISASNTTPEEVWDSAYIKANQTVSLRYVKGSARITNGGKLNGKVVDDDALFGKYGGTFVGYNQGGLLPGGEEYGGNITFRIKVDKAGFDMNCTVSKENVDDYHNDIDAVPGEVLDVKMKIRNTGTTVLRDIAVYDTLGEGIEFIPGTTRIYNDTNPDGTLENDNLFRNGFNIGDYKAGMEATIQYKIRIIDDQNLFPCGQTVVVQNNAAAAVSVGTIHDKLQIRVHRDCKSNTEGSSR